MNQFFETYPNPQELEVRSLYHLYSLKTKSSRCHYVVMTRSETKLSVAIPAPVSGQSAVNVATATSNRDQARGRLGRISRPRGRNFTLNGTQGEVGVSLKKKKKKKKKCFFFFFFF